MNKQDLQQAFSAAHVPEDTLQAVLQREPTKKKGGHRPLVWKLAACAAAMAILLTALLFWPAGSPGEGQQIVAIPGVMKVYACEMGDMDPVQLEEYRLVEGDISSYKSWWSPYVDLMSEGIAITVVLDEETTNDHEIAVSCATNFGTLVYNREVLDEKSFIPNGEVVWWDGLQRSSEDAFRDIRNWKEPIYVDVIIRADGHIVGYAIVEIVCKDEQMLLYYSTLRKSVFYPKVDGQFQNISEEYIQKEMCAYKQAQKPGEGAEYIRHVLEGHK